MKALKFFLKQKLSILSVCIYIFRKTGKLIVILTTCSLGESGKSECVTDRQDVFPLSCSAVCLIKQQKASQEAQEARYFVNGKSKARYNSSREYFVGMASYSELSTP